MSRRSAVPASGGGGSRGVQGEAGAGEEGTGGLRPWQLRARHASEVMEAFREVLVGSMTAADEEDAERWLAGVDPKSHVGSKHHYVPRFLLERWGPSGQVRTYSRIEDAFGIRNIRDLAFRDFYTFINLQGEKDSTMESILGEVEKPAAAVLRDLLNPFARPREIEVPELAALAQFAAFQLVRTPRHRREQELQAEWLAKSMVQGQIPDAQLREISVTPHQNDAISLMSAAEEFMPLLACRPLALVVLDRPLLLIGDEPLLANAGPQEDTHHADCFMTDAEFEAKLARERVKKKGRRRERVSRVVHFRSTVPRGLGVAHEIVLPVSPRAALLWGPLQSAPYTGDVVRERLDGPDSQRFADLANEAMCAQALDWVVSRVDDTTFTSREFPPVGPLMRVCDGENAASVAVNRTPPRLRPARLW